MGMFDTVLIPEDFIKSCVNDDQFKIINNFYKKYFGDKKMISMQTKDLDCCLLTFEIRNNQLFKYDNKKRIFDSVTQDINVYDSFRDDDGNTHSFEFMIKMIRGKFQSIQLNQHTTVSKREIQFRKRSFNKHIKERDKHNKSIKYKFYNFIRKICLKIVKHCDKKCSFKKSISFDDKS